MGGDEHALTMASERVEIRRPAFTLSEAEQVTGASRSTLRRRLAEQAFPNAYRANRSREWRIPVEDLLAAGLPVNRPTPAVSAASDHDQDGADLGHRVVELEALLAVERARREAAEQLATERAARVDDLRIALRLLESGPVGRQHEAAQQPQERPQERPQEPPAPPGPRTPRRRWLSRWRRP